MFRNQKFYWNLVVALVLFVLVMMRAKAAEPPKAGDDLDPDAIEDVDKTDKRLSAAGKRDWEAHPGFFHYGFAVEINYLTAGPDLTGAAQGANGMGIGGMVLLDYDFSRKWLFGFRFMAGYKRLFLASDESIPSAINAFPVMFAVQKLKRVSRISTFRYGLGVSLEVIDSNGTVKTDNALVATLDFDFPFILTGARLYLYKFDSSQNFLGVEALLGFRF